MEFEVNFFTLKLYLNPVSSRRRSPIWIDDEFLNLDVSTSIGHDAFALVSIVACNMFALAPKKPTPSAVYNLRIEKKIHFYVN